MSFFIYTDFNYSFQRSLIRLLLQKADPPKKVSSIFIRFIKFRILAPLPISDSPNSHGWKYFQLLYFLFIPLFSFYLVLPAIITEDYCFTNQLELPFPFSEETLWADLPALLGLDQEKNSNTVVYEPTELTLYQLLSLEPNKDMQSFVMTEVLDAYLHLLELYCEDIAFVPSHAVQIFKAERSLDNISHFYWKDRQLRYVFIPASLIKDAHTALFVFDLRESMLLLLDSDSVRQQSETARMIAEGIKKKDPVLSEILNLFPVILYVFIWAFYIFYEIILGTCMHSYGSLMASQLKYRAGKH